MTKLDILITGIIIGGVAIGLVVLAVIFPAHAPEDRIGPYIRDGHLKHVQDQQTGYCYAYARPGDISSIAVVTWIPCDQAEKETP